MTSYIHPPSEYADFIAHVERNRVTASEISPPSGRRSFIRLSTLRNYLTPKRIRRLLLCYFPTGTYWKAIYNGGYLIVFSILVRIAKVPFLPYFLSNRKLSDAYLPFSHHYDWPRPCHEFFYQFFCEQWQFCAQRFLSDCLFSLQIDERIILPIKSIGLLNKGTDFRVYKIELYDEYNSLTEGDEHGKPTTNIFALKTCNARGIEAYNVEVDAYRILSDQTDIRAHILHFYGSWSQCETYNMLFEYVSGGTLTQFMKNTKPPTQRELILQFWTSMLDVIKPLARIHALSVTDDGHRYLQGIHHDIKPDNILVDVTPNSSTYDVTFKLADLGLTEFEPMSDTDEATIARSNRGTQMFSAPECFIDEADTFLLHTPVNAKPSKDIWSLGCVFSIAAVWSVFGYEGILEYESRRAAETQRMPKLQDTSYRGCFHDTTTVLDVVLNTHRRVCTMRQSDDDLIQQVMGLTSDMLSHASLRPSAVGVYKRSRSILERTSTPSFLRPDGTNSIIERRPPPQIPPEYFPLAPNENTPQMRMYQSESTTGRSLSSDVEIMIGDLSLRDSDARTHSVPARPHINVAGDPEHSRTRAISKDDVRQDRSSNPQNPWVVIPKCEDLNVDFSGTR
ncbi:kinase-like protein [Karstenula rhodostoma CBS 690.94]|uniref:Kinase-like protein n=1 Tax=Karstenula rhodostoma CBS 690.94 TaxID=1392251 RepID=A0A9P4PGH4_9PLEO|nr:kinase-like protein [Karstenula rhodostoma CBS 690.94]